MPSLPTPARLAALAIATLVLAALGACTPEFPDECETDADCNGGRCVDEDGSKICVLPGEGGSGGGGAGGTGGSGGSGGSGGQGGTGGDGGDGGTGGACPAEGCGADHACVDGTCRPDYVLTILEPDADAVVGGSFTARVTATPRQGLGAPAGLTLVVGANGTEVGRIELTPDVDDTWVATVTPAFGVAADENAVTLEATFNTLTTGVRDVLLDDLPPRLEVTPPPATLKRDEPVVVSVSVTDAHLPNPTSPEIAIVPAGGVPTEADYRAPATPGVPAMFAIDQRGPQGFALDGITGSFDVHVRAVDTAGNVARSEAPSTFEVTRVKWQTQPVESPAFSPAIVADGRVAVTFLNPDTNLALIDPQDGTASPHLVGSGTVQFSPSASSAELFITQGRSLLAIDPFDPSGTERWQCAMALSNFTSPAALGTFGGVGTDYAVASLESGDLRAFINFAGGCDSDGSPVSVTAVTSVPAVAGAQDSLQVITGGETPTALYRFDTNDANGQMQPGAEYADASIDIVHRPLALDGTTVFAAPGTGPRIAAAYDFETGQVRAINLGAVTSAGPAVGASFAVFPTNQGLGAIARTIPAQDTPFALGMGAVSGTPVFADDGHLYVVTAAGAVHALRLDETGFTDLWSGDTDVTAATVDSSPTLTCGGLLVFGDSAGTVHAIITDASGLDPTAPWPKYQHDLGNTGNSSTPLACP